MAKLALPVVWVGANGVNGIFLVASGLKNDNYWLPETETGKHYNVFLRN